MRGEYRYLKKKLKKKNLLNKYYNPCNFSSPAVCSGWLSLLPNVDILEVIFQYFQTLATSVHLKKLLLQRWHYMKFQIISA